MSKAVSDEQMTWLKTHAVDVMEALKDSCGCTYNCQRNICSMQDICDLYKARFGVLLGNLMLKEVP